MIYIGNSSILPNEGCFSMDPSFIPIIFSQLNQHFQNINIAKTKAQEEHNRQVLLENRQKLLDAAKTESDILLHEASIKPQNVFVRCQMICYKLDNLKVVPDSYDSQKEKEDVALLWRKLVGISDKCKKLITPDQIEQCNKCLDAIWMQSFIQAIAERLGPYNKLQEIKSELERKREHQKKLRNIWFGILGLITIIAVALLSQTTIFTTTKDLLLTIAIFVFLLGFLIYLWFDSQLRIIGNMYKGNSGSNQDAFWITVKEKFNGIPTEEMLKQSWQEQEEIIKVIFGEPE